MRYLDWLPLVSCLFCAAIAVFVLVRRRGNYGAMAFALGMASLALMELANLITINATIPESILFWKKAGMWCEILVAGNWLLFATIYAKEDIKRVLKKRSWILAPAYIVPSVFLMLHLAGNKMLLTEDMQEIRLGSFGVLFHISLLAVLILALVNLEHTFRSSSDTDRWKIKHTFFGLGAILIFDIYILSQRLLYHSINLGDTFLMSTAIILSTGLMTYSYLRNKIIVGDIYISRNVLHGTVSLFTIGIYLLLVGIAGQLIRSLKLNMNPKTHIVFVLFAVLALLVIFSKDTFKRRVRKSVNRHFRKKKYDYREEWRIFSTVLSKKVQTAEIAEAFVKTLVERIYAGKISLWLVNEDNSKLHRRYSRNLPDNFSSISLNNNILSSFFGEDGPSSRAELLSRQKGSQSDAKQIGTLVDETEAELLVPIAFGEKPLGLLTLGKIRGGEPFDELDDYDLLKSVAAHAASAINSGLLFEEKMRARELEAFHLVSSFVMHDLKNATSMLSLVAQNAKQHICDPEFQKDAIETISEAVARMNKMISSLSTFRAGHDRRVDGERRRHDDLPYNGPERRDICSYQFTDLDLNKVVKDAVEKLAMNGLSQVTVVEEFRQVPRVSGDVEELYKVVHNLLINSCEAMNGKGEIKVSTGIEGDYVAFRVSDEGRGMSRDFVENSLFRPFKTTKEKGFGIGLYQCKSIVEAHGGRIEVESEEGVGTTFSVYLPSAGQERKGDSK